MQKQGPPLRLELLGRVLLPRHPSLRSPHRVRFYPLCPPAVRCACVHAFVREKAKRPSPFSVLCGSFLMPPPQACSPRREFWKTIPCSCLHTQRFSVMTVLLRGLGCWRLRHHYSQDSRQPFSPLAGGEPPWLRAWFGRDYRVISLAARPAHWPSWHPGFYSLGHIPSSSRPRLRSHLLCGVPPAMSGPPRKAKNIPFP